MENLESHSFKESIRNYHTINPKNSNSNTHTDDVQNITQEVGPKEIGKFVIRVFECLHPHSR